MPVSKHLHPHQSNFFQHRRRTLLLLSNSLYPSPSFIFNCKLQSFRLTVIVVGQIQPVYATSYFVVGGSSNSTQSLYSNGSRNVPLRSGRKHVLTLVLLNAVDWESRVVALSVGFTTLPDLQLGWLALLLLLPLAGYAIWMLRRYVRQFFWIFFSSHLHRVILSLHSPTLTGASQHTFAGEVSSSSFLYS